jgi:hypothetical protein
MADQNSAEVEPNHQNSVVERQVRPNELMEALGIKKDAYYSYLKHLGIKAQKDNDGQAYLDPEQAERIRQLREHVLATGKLEGFEEKALATSEAAGLGDVPPWEESPASGSPTHMSELIRQAQELAAHNMAMGDLVVAQLAQQMTFEDLPPELQQKVAQVKEATYPKANPAEIASQIIQQWRSQRGTAAA